MKKIKFLLMAVVAISLASCGGKTQKEEEKQDTVSFEQEQLEASVRVQLDSLAGIIGGLKPLPMLAQTKNGTIQLTEQEKQVKPDYLLDPSTATDAVTLSEKYRILVALTIDQEIAQLYGMDTKVYNETTSKLISEINDPGFKLFAENPDSLTLESQAVYDAEAKAGRLNYFWQAVATSIVEQLYILEQNPDKFLPCFDDESVSKLTFRIAILQDAIQQLTKYDPDIVEVSEALTPLYKLNSTSVAQFKTDLESMKADITTARNRLVK